VVAGIVAGVFGGSNLQISGPTGAMTVVLVPIAARHGANGVLTVGLLAGFVLVGLALAGAGRYVRFVPLPVIEGFTLGIALVISLQQVPSALGVPATTGNLISGAGHALQLWGEHPNAAPVLVTLSVAGTMLFMARLRPGIPISLGAVIAATVVSASAHLKLPTIGILPSSLPSPRLPGGEIGPLTGLVVPALAVAALAALESLLSATVADAMSVGERHDGNRELFGQGLANLVSPLFGGMPATAAIARTAVNVRSGARSRLAAVTQSLTLLVVVLLAARWVSHVPLAALAGVLLATCVQMVEFSSLRALLGSTRGDAFALVFTATATVAFDLVTAVGVGLVVASAFALRQMARSAQLEEAPLDLSDHSEEERALLQQHVVAYRLDGPLFFGAAHTFLLALADVSDVRVVVLRLSRVSTLDATGAAVLADTIGRLEGRGVTVLLSGIRDEHLHVLTRLGVFDRLAHERHVFATTPEALEHARSHAARSRGHHPATNAS
jgi:MFS superfamily sulfate permease-like transporter